MTTADTETQVYLIQRLLCEYGKIKTDQISLMMKEAIS
jgi:hypothetical protein